MIILRDIQLRRADRLLLENANATLLPGQKIALTGANGCGKSSLFAMLLGELGADGGSIDGLSGQRIAHMAQDVAASAKSAAQFVLEGDGEVAQLLKHLARQEAEEDFEGVAQSHQALEACDGYSAERRVEGLLRGLGFSSEDQTRPLSDFSGGWRVRLALARALMAPSEVLLLDEPTNHLDLDTSLWLQSFLRRYRGTLLLISHDRDFIDATCDGVMHIEQRELRSYRGGYSAFEQQRAERLAEQRASAAKQARRRAEIEDFVRRFRAKATKARQAQSRLKELERMGEMAVAHVDSPFEFRFPEAPRAADPMLSLHEAVIGFERSSPLIGACDLAVRAGDRLALLGRNGCGKTTLLRSLCGELPLLAGERLHSDGCRVAYFDQQQIDALDLEASALLHLQRLTPDVREQELRDFLGGFDFRGSRAEVPIAPFSGGEKARLALAMLAWQRPNLLILDEPTNHLDLEMRRALELALADFGGAVILVSHDRHLLRSSTEHLYRIHQGELREYNGDLEDYEKELLGGESTATSGSAAYKAMDTPAPDFRGSSAERKEQRKAAAAERALRKPIEQRVRKIEQAMADCQQSLDEIETILADAALYTDESKDRLQEQLQRQGEARRKLETLEADWLREQEQLEALSTAGATS